MKAKITNVKKHLERVERLAQHLSQQTMLPPAYLDEIKSISFMTRAILRIHAAKNTRKDIRIEV